MSFLPGISEMRMATNTYFEKLKDPRWQKKRLEVLEHGNWACERCCDTESTLHVHHRQYFKGREPWDYEVGQLAVLCEECHGATHESEDNLLLACSFVQLEGPRNRDAAAGLVAGFCRHDMGKNYVVDPDAYLAGEVAYEFADKALVHQMMDLAKVLSQRDQHTVREAIAVFIEDLKTRPAAVQPQSLLGYSPL
jgi:hypothetical protein